MRSRLGDDIDDFCVKCKRVMNHLVVSLLNDEPAKVRCRTCHGDHDFRHEQAPPPKIDARKAALIQAALEKAAAAPGAADGLAVAGVVDGAVPGAVPEAIAGEATAMAVTAESDAPAVVSSLPVPAVGRTPARKSARAE